MIKSNIFVNIKRERKLQKHVSPRKQLLETKF